MNWRLLVNVGQYLAAYGLKRVEEKVKAWTKPTTECQIVGIGSDLMRSKPELVPENVYLRQQVIVLKRQIKGKPQLTQHDRRVLVLLASKLKGWREALHIAKPDTLLKWRRQEKSRGSSFVTMTVSTVRSLKHWPNTVRSS